MIVKMIYFVSGFDLENVYQIEDTKEWDILESEARRGEWCEGETGEWSDNCSENPSDSSLQARRLSSRNCSFIKYKSPLSVHSPAKYRNGRLGIYQRTDSLQKFTDRDWKYY